MAERICPMHPCFPSILTERLRVHLDISGWHFTTQGIQREKKYWKIQALD